MQDALTSNRYQLVLAMKCKDSAAAASALTCLGHVYTVRDTVQVTAIEKGLKTEEKAKVVAAVWGE